MEDPCVMPTVDGALVNRDARLFDFFRIQTLPLLNGVFPGQTWTRTLIAAIQHDDMVRHSMLSVAACHEVREQRRKDGVDTATDDERSGLSHYNEAVMLLRTAISSCNRISTTIRLAVMLFILFETMQDRVEVLSMHLHNALSLLPNCRSPTPLDRSTNNNSMKCSAECLWCMRCTDALAVALTDGHHSGRPSPKNMMLVRCARGEKPGRPSTASSATYCALWLAWRRSTNGSLTRNPFEVWR